MHALDLVRNAANVPDKPVYVIYGDEAFLRREALDAIVKSALKGEEADLAVARFEGDKATLADVLDEVRTLAFFSSRRVVIVDGADPFVTAHRKELEEYVEHPSQAGVLVLLVKTWVSSTKLAKAVEKSGLAVECKGLSERELTPWLIQLAKSRFQTTIDTDAARLLVELVGPEVGLLAAELEKLTIYVGTRAKIQREDVARMVGAGRIETIWKTVEKAMTGRSDLAIEHLDGLLGAGESPIGLLAAMSFSLLRVHHAGRLRSARMRLEDACREAGITHRSAVELTGAQHAHLGPRRVDRIPEMLLQADLDLKGSSTLTPRVVLESLIVQFGRPRED
jgi:DNA polymerase-3 subunit delta